MRISKTGFSGDKPKAAASNQQFDGELLQPEPRAVGELDGMSGQDLVSLFLQEQLSSQRGLPALSDNEKTRAAQLQAAGVPHSSQVTKAVYVNSQLAQLTTTLTTKIERDSKTLIPAYIGGVGLGLTEDGNPALIVSYIPVNASHGDSVLGFYTGSDVASFFNAAVSRGETHMCVVENDRPGIVSFTMQAAPITSGDAQVKDQVVDVQAQ